jgi:hypothetical protein
MDTATGKLICQTDLDFKTFGVEEQADGSFRDDLTKGPFGKRLHFETKKVSRVFFHPPEEHHDLASGKAALVFIIDPSANNGEGRRRYTKDEF